MFCHNLKSLRKAKGLSQEELAIKLSVVRQTVSKWENGISVPDAEMLIKIAEVLDSTVNILLGEQVIIEEETELKAIASKLELLNEQMAQRNERVRRIWRIVFIIVIIITACSLLFTLLNFMYYRAVMSDMSTTTSIIGGNDGTTNIFVSNVSLKFVNIIFTVVALVISVIGIYKTRKK